MADNNAYGGARIFAKIKRLRLIIAISSPLTIISAFFGIIFFGAGLSGENPSSIHFVVFAVMWVIGFTSGTIAKQSQKNLKNFIGENVVKSVIASKIELSFYDPAGHIEKDVMKRASLIPEWNTVIGSDLFEGRYRGVKITCSDVHFDYIQVIGGRSKSRAMGFEGQWIILELDKEILHGLKIRERGEPDLGKKSNVETENIEFNKRFIVKASDPHTAFYILTPHFMEYIMKADDRADSKIYIGIEGRHIHIALHNARNLFEYGNKNRFAAKNIQNLRARMEWEMNFITGIIDEFLKNEFLFNARNIPT